MNGKSFLETARLLRDKGKSEADFRSAISRAYYACFLEFADALFRACPEEWQTKSCPDAKSIRHNNVSICLMDSVYDDVEKTGWSFRLLQKKRELADYDMSWPFERRDASEAIYSGEILLTALAAFEPKQIEEAAKYAASLYKTKR